jgi:hypothetical protein
MKMDADAKNKWVVLLVGLGMIAATWGYLAAHRHVHLGEPGVRVGAVNVYDEHGDLAAHTGVLLPERVLGQRGANVPVTRSELDTLPKDTTFGRKLYVGKNNTRVQVSVVLMGADRTSIHQPQFCLLAQDWTIDRTERVLLPMDRPHRYELPALKLTTSRQVKDEQGRPLELRGFYVYWFVTDKKITSDQGARLWSIAKTMLEKEELERWAYISYFVTCLPGQEKTTFESLEDFIRMSVPDFQTVAGPPSNGPERVAAR